MQGNRAQRFLISGGFKGVQGAMAPGPALMVAKRGPYLKKEIVKNKGPVFLAPGPAASKTTAGNNI